MHSLILECVHACGAVLPALLHEGSLFSLGMVVHSSIFDLLFSAVGYVVFLGLVARILKAGGKQTIVAIVTLFYFHSSPLLFTFTVLPATPISVLDEVSMPSKASRNDTRKSNAIKRIEASGVSFSRAFPRWHHSAAELGANTLCVIEGVVKELQKRSLTTSAIEQSLEKAAQVWKGRANRTANKPSAAQFQELLDHLRTPPALPDPDQPVLTPRSRVQKKTTSEDPIDSEEDSGGSEEEEDSEEETEHEEDEEDEEEDDSEGQELSPHQEDSDDEEGSDSGRERDEEDLEGDEEEQTEGEDQDEPDTFNHQRHDNEDFNLNLHQDDEGQLPLPALMAKTSRPSIQPNQLLNDQNAATQAATQAQNAYLETEERLQTVMRSCTYQGLAYDITCKEGPLPDHARQQQQQPHQLSRKRKMQDDGDDAEDEDDPEESAILASQREQKRHDNEWIASETQALEEFKRQRISRVTDLMRKRRAIWEKRAWAQKAARAANDRIKLESKFELLRGRYEGIQLDPGEAPDGQRLHERGDHDRTPDGNPARDRDGREEDEGTEKGGESRNGTAVANGIGHDSRDENGAG